MKKGTKILIAVTSLLVIGGAGVGGYFLGDGHAKNNLFTETEVQQAYQDGQASTANQIESLQNEINTKLNTINNLNKQLDDVNKLLTQSTDEISNLNLVLTDKQEQISLLQQNIESLTEQLENAEDENAELASLISENQTLIASLNLTINSLNEQLETKTEENQGLMQQISSLNSQIQTLTEEVTSLTLLVNAYRQENGELAEVKFYNDDTGELLKIVLVEPSNTIEYNDDNISSIFELPGYKVGPIFHINEQSYYAFKITDDMSIYVTLQIMPSGGFEIQDGQPTDQSGVIDVSQTGFGQGNINYNLSYVEKDSSGEELNSYSGIWTFTGKGTFYLVNRPLMASYFHFTYTEPVDEAYIKVTITETSIIYESHSYTHEDGQIDYFNAFSIAYII